MIGSDYGLDASRGNVIKQLREMIFAYGFSQLRGGAERAER